VVPAESYLTFNCQHAVALHLGGRIRYHAPQSMCPALVTSGLNIATQACRASCALQCKGCDHPQKVWGCSLSRMNENLAPYGRGPKGRVVIKLTSSKHASMHLATVKVSGLRLNASMVVPHGKRCAKGARAARVAGH